MGRDIFIDVHIQVYPYISVSEGHYIAQHVHHQLIETLTHVKDVTVHVDPEDDEVSCPSIHLPTRAHLQQTLLNKWRQDYPDIQFWILHYLDGEIIIDLICNEAMQARSLLQTRITQDISRQNEVIKVRLFSQNNEITLAN